MTTAIGPVTVSISALGAAFPSISRIAVLVKLRRCITELLILLIWVFILDLALIMAIGVAILVLEAEFSILAFDCGVCTLQMCNRLPILVMFFFKMARRNSAVFWRTFSLLFSQKIHDYKNEYEATLAGLQG